MAGLLTATALFLVLPPTLYRTEAVVGVGDPTTPLRDAMTDAAATAAVSKPVMAQAAASLIGTNVAAPEPGVFDRLWVTAGIDRAVGGAARLADTLTAAVDARSTAPGIVKVSADAPDANQAAHMATAVAEALVADQDRQAIDLRRQAEIRARQGLEGLKAAVNAARRKFTALGGTDVDPAHAMASAASETAAAQARLDVVRSIVASGSPPLSDRHDLPENAAALQAAYLSLSQQLATAKETLGDRHTTVISLREGLKRAAANLTDEWKRLTKVAESELAAARDRETAARKVESPPDPAKRAALDGARRSLMVAEEAVTAAESLHRDGPVDTHSYRLVAEAPIPSTAVGFSLPWRLLLSALAGLAALGLMRALSTLPFRSASPLERAADPSVNLAPVAIDEEREEPSFFETAEVPTASAPEQTIVRRPRPVERPVPVRARSIGRPMLDVEGHDLHEMMLDILPSLESIVSQTDVPVLMIATNQAGIATTPVALALSQTAAEAGHRVLLVEASGSDAALAASVARDAEPSLVDIFGTLRVVLASDTRNGLLYLAPSFRDGHQLAAGLARAPEVPLVEDLADVFDLVIVDSGEATDADEVAAVADAVLRVGSQASARDDDRFLKRFGIARRALLGTVTDSAFVPAHHVERPRIVPAPPQQPQTLPRMANRPSARPATITRRKVAGRH